MNIIGVVPARLESTRLNRKALEKINGVPMVVVVAKEMKKSKMFSEIYVATDSVEIFYECVRHNVSPIITITGDNFVSGTDRVCSVAKNQSFDLLVNIQGDEPTLVYKDAEILIDFHLKNDFQTCNLLNLNYDSCESEDINVVKANLEKDVITDYERSSHYKTKQIGMYSFTRKALEIFESKVPGPVESKSRIEMFRYIENGFDVGGVCINRKTVSVDTKADLENAREILKC